MPGVYCWALPFKAQLCLRSIPRHGMYTQATPRDASTPL